MQAVSEGDVDYDGLGEGQQAGAQQVAQRPGCFGGEGWEDQGAVYAVELVEVARGEGDFGRHCCCVPWDLVWKIGWFDLLGEELRRAGLEGDFGGFVLVFFFLVGATGVLWFEL